jgi:hypothetical protein
MLLQASLFSASSCILPHDLPLCMRPQVSIRQHMRPQVSIRQHMRPQASIQSAYEASSQHASAYEASSQHTSAYEASSQHTSAYCPMTCLYRHIPSAYTHIHTHAQHTHVRIHEYIRMYVYTYIHIHIHIYLSVCVCVPGVMLNLVLRSKHLLPCMERRSGTCETCCQVKHTCQAALRVAIKPRALSLSLQGGVRVTCQGARARSLSLYKAAYA